MPVIPTLRRRLGQEDCQEFMVSFDYRMNSCLKKRRRRKKKKKEKKEFLSSGHVWPFYKWKDLN